jgi:5-methyltetrahydrofolate--homocysteine methyltransferase
VFYGEDAFAGLNIMKDLTSVDGDRQARLAEGRAVKAAVARAAAGGGEAVAVMERSPAVEALVDFPPPPFYGARVARDFDLREVFEYINQTALFKNQWQLKTASQQDYARLVEEKYRPILCELEQEVIARGWFEPQAVYGWFGCQSEGNDVIIYEPAGAQPGAAVPHEYEPGEHAQPGAAVPHEIQRFTFPRQRDGRRLSIADFFAPRSSGRMDVVGMSLVTIGGRASEETKKLFEAGEYTKYLYLHGLSVETAEALAELLHKRMRQELGIAGEDAERISDLFHQKYRGSRYSFGYPACPNLEDQTKLFALLKPETIGVRLTSTFLLEPEQSTSAIVVHHPGAKYFVV